RYIDHGRIGAGFGNGFADGVEHRQTQMFLTAFAGSNTADHLGAVGDGLFGVEGALRAGETLTDHSRIFVDQNAHCAPPAAFTTCSAASVRLLAAMMFRPLSASTLAPSSALLPSRR